MRKIIPQHIEERKTKRNQLVLAVSLIALMLLSTIAYSFQYLFGDSNKQDQQEVNYKGFKFIQQNELWVLKLNIGDFIFSYNPNDVKKANGSINGFENYRDKKLYIYSENTEAESEIRINMAQFVESIEKACLDNMKCDQNILIKTCDENFIIIKSGNEGIKQDKNCVFIEGKNEDLVNLADSFLLKILGINS